MKDQYFGDVNDFRKYGLLRNLVLPTRLRLGVCWMLTASDGRSDGNFLSYLHQPERYERCDPDLLRWMRSVVHEERDRRVVRIEGSRVLLDAVFQSEMLTDDGAQRGRYFAECQQMFRECDLVFFDPDNGVEIGTTGKVRRNSSKFVFWDELQATFAAGSSVLVYQHFPRLDRAQFIARLASELGHRLGTHSVFSFRTPHVVFLLAAQDRHVDVFRGEMGTIDRTWRVAQSRKKPQIAPSECNIPEVRR